MPYRVKLPPARPLDAPALSVRPSPSSQPPVTPVATGEVPVPVSTPKGDSVRFLASDYMFPWPDAVPGLGARSVWPFTSCSSCHTWTWVAYGDTPLCLACAKKRA
jgi:hypothetical protein